MDGISVLEEMRLNPGVLYRCDLLPEYVEGFFWDSNTEEYMVLDHRCSFVAAFNSNLITSKGWYAVPQATDPATKLSDLLTGLAHHAVDRVVQGPEYARGLLAAAAIAAERGL